MSLSNAQGFIGAFDVLMAPIASNGDLGLMKNVGNCTKFSIKPNATIKQQKSRRRDTYGQILETVALQEPGELSVTLETVNRDNLRYCVMGEDATYTQTGATVVDEVVVMRLDGWVQLAAEDLQSTVTLTHTSGTPTYVEGTDYEINRRTGMVRAITGGAISDEQSCKIDYVSNTFTGAAIRGNVQPQLRVYMKLDGLNKVDNSLYLAEFYEVVLTPSGEFDFMKDDWNSIELTGKLKTPPSKSEPFVIRQR